MSPIRLNSNRRETGVSVPIKLGPNDVKNRENNKLASIYKAPIIRGLRAASLKARKIVPFSVFHSNLSGMNPNLQSISTNDASATPNF